MIPISQEERRNQINQDIQKKILSSSICIGVGIVGVLAGTACAIVGGVIGITWLIPVGIAIAIIALLFGLVNLAERITAPLISDHPDYLDL